ncbi:MAG: hypothetical protein AAGE05_00100 [Pseudomonadota bacterium]
MLPSKDHFPRAAGLFGRIAGMPSKIRDRRDASPDLPNPDSYRKALLRNAVAFTVGRRKDRDS